MTDAGLVSIYNTLIRISLGVLIVAVALFDQNTFTISSFSSFMQSTSILGILSISVLCICNIGYIDFGIGVQMVFYSMLFTILTKWIPVGLAALIILAAGIAVGFILDYFCEKIQASSVVPTLGIAVIMYGATLSMKKHIVPLKFNVPAIYPFLLFLILWLVFQVMMKYTVIGIEIKGIAESPEKAVLNGIKTKTIKRISNMSSYMLVALAGIIVVINSGAAIREYHFGGIEIEALSAGIAASIGLVNSRKSRTMHFSAILLICLISYLCRYHNIYEQFPGYIIRSVIFIVMVLMTWRPESDNFHWRNLV